MESTVKLLVWGDYACFTRPELKAERMSYEAITPSAARGILDSIHWKPAIRWEIDRIHVLKPIRFETIIRNEVKSKGSVAMARRAMQGENPRSIVHDITDTKNTRVQRSTLALRNVAYGIEAHFEMTPKAGPGDNPGKHASIFRRRAEKGQCFQRPCLGLREFAADFELVEDFPETEIETPDRDLGLMLYEFDYVRKSPVFYRAGMENGVIDVAAARREGLFR